MRNGNEEDIKKYRQGAIEDLGDISTLADALVVENLVKEKL
jgi:hypothetical protein